ncbi:MAG TPA: cyanophycin synthetase [Bacilli bacterium]|nr:cyanophycin synthetase [Bacilli bacterium]HPS19312.1 cyanophycin synthetase [Bacilli bacterium]
MKNLDSLISFRQNGDYQRDNFDRFLDKISFRYEIPSVHIAGTNGKGSTASYLASIYRKAGYKVGLFVSPSLNQINEMITVDDKAISDEQIGDIIEKYRRDIIRFELSAFEIEALIAFSFFSSCQCDISIIECGMGGLVDATNVFIPILSIITSVSLEHTDYLGRSITEVSEQKAGIIKEEIPVLVGDLSEDVLAVIFREAQYKRSEVRSVSIPNNVLYSETGYSFDYLTFRNLKIQSIAQYSVYDACLAVEATQILGEQFPVDDENVAEGLYELVIPARMEVMRTSPLVIIDGAHNPEAMENLMISIEKASNSRPIHTVFACFKDKNFPLMLSFIGQIGEVILTTFDHPRARQKEDYFLFADEYEFFEDPRLLIMELMEKYPDDVILITGSLAFAGYVRELFRNGELK